MNREDAVLDRIRFLSNALSEIKNNPGGTIECDIRDAENRSTVEEFLGNEAKMLYWLAQSIKFRMIKINRDHCGESKHI